MSDYDAIQAFTDEIINTADFVRGGGSATWPRDFVSENRSRLETFRDEARQAGDVGMVHDLDLLLELGD